VKARTILLFPFRVIGAVLCIVAIIVFGAMFIGTAAASGGGTVLVAIALYVGLKYLWRRKRMAK